MILEILGHFLNRHISTKSGHSRATARDIRGGHASPRIHTRSQHRCSTGRHKASSLAADCTSNDKPSYGRGSPLPPTRKFCKQGGRRPYLCRGDRAGMGGFQPGPIGICLSQREIHFWDSQ